MAFQGYYTVKAILSTPEHRRNFHFHHSHLFLNFKFKLDCKSYCIRTKASFTILASALCNVGLDVEVFLFKEY